MEAVSRGSPGEENWTGVGPRQERASSSEGLWKGRKDGERPWVSYPCIGLLQESW